MALSSFSGWTETAPTPCPLGLGRAVLNRFHRLIWLFPPGSTSTVVRSAERLLAAPLLFLKDVHTCPLVQFLVCSPCGISWFTSEQGGATAPPHFASNRRSRRMLALGRRSCRKELRNGRSGPNG